MLIEVNGNVNKDVTGVILKDKDVLLGEDQFFQWTPTGNRLELWNGKSEFGNSGTSLRRVSYWNKDSVIAFIL